MRVLVCGGAGYIGSNMTAVLASAGHEPVVYDNLSRGHKFAVGDMPFVQGDLGDHGLLCETLKKYSIDVVMHFAALIEVGESVKEPLRFYENNFCNTRNLLQAMQDSGVDKFVFSSTAAVYGMPAVIPVPEDCDKNPINPYGQSKWDVEQMCYYQSLTGRLRYAALRYFNACGAGFDSRLGEDHRPESHLIPLVIHAAMGKRKSVSVFGTDYPTADGTCVRDYIHVEDLCRAHLLAIEKLDSQSQQIYNLGTGTGYSVREVIETVKAVSGVDFEVVEKGRRAGDSAVLTADASKAEKELGWQRKYTELKGIVATAWQWHNKYPDGYPE